MIQHSLEDWSSKSDDLSLKNFKRCNYCKLPRWESAEMNVVRMPICYTSTPPLNSFRIDRHCIYIAMMVNQVCPSIINPCLVLQWTVLIVPGDYPAGRLLERTEHSYECYNPPASNSCISNRHKNPWISIIQAPPPLILVSLVWSSGITQRSELVR